MEKESFWKKLILQGKSFSPELRAIFTVLLSLAFRRVINDWKMKKLLGHFLSILAFIPPGYLAGNKHSMLSNICLRTRIVQILLSCLLKYN
jgi:hypothetical protein